MFRIARANQHVKARLLAAAQQAPLSSPRLLTLSDGPVGTPPKGFAHDLTRSALGCGVDAFAAARRALLNWEQFDLGWVQVANGVPKVALGEFVAVEAHALLWSINGNRIVELVDTPTRFGFLYTTTALHIEQGQERFVIDLDQKTQSVSYLIEAVSRPRHPLALMAYPFTRAMQRRFARDSHARMKQSVAEQAANLRSEMQI